MSMKQRMRATEPDTIDLTLEVTMSLREWRQFQKQLNGSYPSWRFSEAIGEMVDKANQHFAPAPDKRSPDDE